MGNKSEEITILGAGIIGICTALSLRERGFRVTVLDRNPPAEGASYGNAGSLSPWSCVPQSMPGLWKNVPRWLIDSEGPIAVRLGYSTAFLPWALKFFRSGRKDGLDMIADAMMALTRPTIELYRKHLIDTGQEKTCRGFIICSCLPEGGRSRFIPISLALTT